MLVPTRNQVVVIEATEEERTAGGIWKPQTATSALKKGVVTAVGPGVYVDGKLQPMDIEVNDFVVFHAGQCHEVSEGSQKYLILHENSILCKVKPEKQNG